MEYWFRIWSFCYCGFFPIPLYCLLFGNRFHKNNLMDFLSYAIIFWFKKLKILLIRLFIRNNWLSMQSVRRLCSTFWHKFKPTAMVRIDILVKRNTTPRSNSLIGCLVSSYQNYPPPYAFGLFALFAAFVLDYRYKRDLSA